MDKISTWVAYRLIVGLGLWMVTISPTFGIDWYVSGEQSSRAGSGSVAEQKQAASDAVDALNDAREQDGVGDIVMRSFGSGEKEQLGTVEYEFNKDGTSIATMTRVQMDGPSIGTPNGTSTQPSLDDGDELQDGAPFPTSLLGQRFWTESRGGSSSARNAARFDVLVPIRGFGVWVGDLETRTDGQGTPAEVHLLDEDGDLIDMIPIDPGISDQSGCGGDGSSESISACGNEVTRWIGFHTDTGESIKTILIIVGDDDDDLDGGTTDGNTEHLSLIGPRFVLGCEDTDGDLICNGQDVCPEDANKGETEGCGCGIVDPLELGSECESEVNSCGANGVGVIECDGSCSAPKLSLPDRYDQKCSSEPNSCGEVSEGSIDCNGECYAFVPDLPEGYQDTCISEENSCGMTNAGVLGCDLMCTAQIPDEDLCEGIEEGELINEEEDEEEDEEEEEEEEEKEKEPQEMVKQQVEVIRDEDTPDSNKEKEEEEVGVNNENDKGESTLEEEQSEIVQEKESKTESDINSENTSLEESQNKENQLAISETEETKEVQELTPAKVQIQQNNTEELDEQNIEEISYRGSGGSHSTFQRLEYCGNGVIEEGEECDDGNWFTSDECSNSCIIKTNDIQTLGTIGGMEYEITKTTELLVGTNHEIMQILDESLMEAENEVVDEERLVYESSKTSDEIKSHSLISQITTYEATVGEPELLPKTGAGVIALESCDTYKFLDIIR